MYRLLKSLNNNVALVKDEQGQQAVVMGLGIVHNKKKGDIIPDARIEKLFSLKTGYGTSSTSRLPDCLVEWCVKRLKEEGADAIKFLLYYDVDGDQLWQPSKTCLY